MKILLTNDDSNDSPLFEIIIREAKKIGKLEIVVPGEEQSWKGKSMSKMTPLKVKNIDIEGQPAMSVFGTPADCVNLGIYHLTESSPDVVLSGINIGVNTGVAFTFSSGTVGACFEANIAGIPAIAISQDLDHATFMEWSESRHFRDAVLSRLNHQIEVMLPDVFTLIVEDRKGLTEPITWNINLPFHMADDWEIKDAFLGHSFYRSCFTKNGDQFNHELAPFESDTALKSDIAIVKSGHISLTRIDIRKLGQLSTE